MLIEKKLEQKIKDSLLSCFVDDDIEVIGSWSHTDSDTFKGEKEIESKGVVSLYVEPRNNDSFSMPTVNINGTIALDCRIEQCPTMAEVGTYFEKIINLLDNWHYDSQTFSNQISFEGFFATELKMNGGTKVNYDDKSNTWTVSINFQIRGTVER